MKAGKVQRQQLDEGPRIAPQPPPGRSSSKVARALVILGVVVLVLGLALQELRTRGTSAVGGITVANYRAVAKVDDRPAPEFEMPALGDTSNIALRDFAGEVVVLNFWASWCGPCRAEASELERTWKAYRDQGVQFLGVDYRDDRAAGRAFVGEFDLTYPSLFDPAGQLAFDYELVGLPTTFVIGPDGRIVYKFTGRIDAAILGSALDDVLSGENA